MPSDPDRNERPVQLVRVALLPREAADALGISERTLRSWQADGFGPPAIRRGQIVLYPLEKLTEWANATAREGGAA